MVCFLCYSYIFCCCCCCSENDVLILAAAMIKFQRLFKDLSDMPGNRLDIITSCLTIASACISFFLANYVERDDKRFAIVPAGG